MSRIFLIRVENGNLKESNSSSLLCAASLRSSTLFPSSALIIEIISCLSIHFSRWAFRGIS